MLRLKRKVNLPRTFDEFDALVAKVVSEFKLEDKHHAAAIISVAIQHLPNHQGYTTIDYLGGWVIKNLAYTIARHKGEVLRHESQISQLEAILTENRNDQKAYDELTKAAKEGSELAQKALDKLFPALPVENVVSINQTIQ